MYYAWQMRETISIMDAVRKIDNIIRREK